MTPRYRAIGMSPIEADDHDRVRRHIEHQPVRTAAHCHGTGRDRGRVNEGVDRSMVRSFPVGCASLDPRDFFENHGFDRSETFGGLPDQVRV
jgi:hypothetical protein